MMLLPIELIEQVQNLNSFVRDFYFYHRNFYPQLSLVKLDPDSASFAVQRRVGSSWLFPSFPCLSESQCVCVCHLCDVVEHQNRFYE